LVENKENNGGKVKKILFDQQFDWAQFKVCLFPSILSLFYTKQIKGRLNLNKTTSIGHRFGGASALAATTVIFSL
jgi:hypothetical protein